MRRHFVVLMMCAGLGIPLSLAAARAGGPPLSQRPFQTLGAAPMHGSFRVQPPFSSQGAFGSPGGFPLEFPGRHQARLTRLPHRVFLRSPATTVLYTPSALYGPPVDTQSPAISVSPTINVSPTIYVSTPIVASPPATAAAPFPLVSPAPSVVEYPTGRYELRGDGVATPYVWVWIPNPPPLPPAAPPPSPEEPRAGSSPSTMRSQIYRWTDDEGTTFWTNRVESIPEPLRSRAQKSGQIAAQP